MPAKRAQLILSSAKTLLKRHSIIFLSADVEKSVEKEQAGFAASLEHLITALKPLKSSNHPSQACLCYALAVFIKKHDETKK